MPAQTKGAALRVASGHQQSWPGVTLPAPGGRWDLSAYGQVLLEVKNVGTNQVTVSCRVDNPGADGTIIPNYDHSEVIEAVFKRTRVTVAVNNRPWRTTARSGKLSCRLRISRLKAASQPSASTPI